MYNLSRNAYAFFWLHVYDLNGNPSGWEFFSFNSYLSVPSDMNITRNYWMYAISNLLWVSERLFELEVFIFSFISLYIF